MSEATFLALDFWGAVHHLAWCEASSGAGPDSPAWLIRSRIRRMHSWLASTNPGDSGSNEPEQLAAIIEQWGVRAGHTPLVPLARQGGPDVFSVAQRLACSAVIMPRGNHVISPRGIALAADVKDYVHNCSDPAWPGIERIRDAFVSMMERAADDVQADGLEQDDSFIDRFAQIRIHGLKQSFIVPVETTTDAQWLLQSWEAHLGGGHPARLSSHPEGEHPARLSSHLGGGHPARLASASSLSVTTETVEILTLLLRGVVEPAVASISPVAPTDGNLARACVPDPGGNAYARDKLLAGDAGIGPTLIWDERAPIHVPPGWAWELSRTGHISCRLVQS